MFTGIVTDVGEVLAVTPRAAGMRFRIATGYDPETIAIGASIACSGPCLTVVERGDREPRLLRRRGLDRDAGAHQPRHVDAGPRVNLERSLKLGDELGGHLVSGHIDGVAKIVERRDEGDMARFTFEAPAALARFIAEKGSVSLDGTSLTVNGVAGRRFDVMIIPHTLAVTTWGERRAGDVVNLEVDLFARYLERLRAAPA